MRISDWSSDVCSSDLCDVYVQNDEDRDKPHRVLLLVAGAQGYLNLCRILTQAWLDNQYRGRAEVRREWLKGKDGLIVLSGGRSGDVGQALESGRLPEARALAREWRSEEHTSELQSLMRISYAVFCLKKKRQHTITRAIKI